MQDKTQEWQVFQLFDEDVWFRMNFDFFGAWPIAFLLKSMLQDHSLIHLISIGMNDGSFSIGMKLDFFGMWPTGF